MRIVGTMRNQKEIREIDIYAALAENLKEKWFGQRKNQGKREGMECGAGIYTCEDISMTGELRRVYIYIYAHTPIRVGFCI